MGSGERKYLFSRVHHNSFSWLFPLGPLYHSCGHKVFLFFIMRHSFGCISHSRIVLSVRLFSKIWSDSASYVCNVSHFWPGHLLGHSATAHDVPTRNLASNVSTTLNDEESHRETQSRLTEEGLSPESRTLLLVGSRQLRHQSQVFIDDPSPELSDVRTVTLVLLHLQCTTKYGSKDLPDGSKNMEECDELTLCLFLNYLHNSRLPELIDRLLGSDDEDTLFFPDSLLVDFQLALQKSVGSLHFLITDRRTLASFCETTLLCDLLPLTLEINVVHLRDLEIG